MYELINFKYVQVSPDLPDARLPNMPNNQAADINKTVNIDKLVI